MTVSPPTPVKRLVVAVAFDNQAIGLVTTAAIFCQRTGLNLTLTHVLEAHADYVSAESLVQSDTLWNTMRAIAVDAKDLARQRLAELASIVPAEVRVQTAVLQGPFVETLCKHVKASETELLLVGAHFGPAEHWSPRLASALALLSSANVPVAVCDGSRLEVCKDLFKERPKIMVADDLGDGSKAAFGFALDLCKKLQNPDLMHVHVNGIRQDVLEAALKMAIAASHTPADPASATTGMFASLMDQLQERLRRRLQDNDAEALQRRGGTHKTILLTGDVVDQISMSAARLAPDFVVFGRHRAVHTGPFFMGRAPFKAMLALRRPIIIVPNPV